MPVSQIYVTGTINDSSGVITEFDTVTMDNTTAPQSIIQYNLTTGNTTIPVPSIARGVIITCDSNCDSTKSLRGNAADVGITIFNIAAVSPRNQGSIIIPFGSPPPANIVINTSAGVSPDPGFTTFTFF